MLRTIAFFFMLAPSLLHAQDYCGLNEPQPEAFIPSDGLLGDYWTNMMGDDIVMFTPATGNGNPDFPNAYHLKTKERYHLTGEIDPFPVPDGRKIYVHPGPVRFYEFNKVKEAVKKGIDPLTLYKMPPEDLAHYKRDKDSETDANNMMSGEYQSVGVLKSDAHSSVYRVLTGGKEGAFKDYKIVFGKDDEIKSITSVSKPKLVCPELRKSDKVDLNFDTPILSPKGDEFAINDRKSQTTKIIKFDPQTGHCSDPLDLGFEAGKLHFNADGSKIAFHTQALRLGNHQLNSELPRGYMLDRKTNKIISLKVGPRDDNTSESFPSFLKNGNILYQQVRFDSKTGKQHRAWVIVDPKKINALNFVKYDPKNDCSIMDENTPLAILGRIYQEMCKDGKDESLVWSVNLDPEKCKALIENKSDDLLPKVLSVLKIEKDKASKINKEALLAACPTIKPVKEGRIIETPGTYERVHPVLQKCMGCHYPSSKNGYIPFDDREKLNNDSSGLRNKIRTMINSRKMPPDGPPLSDEEIQYINSWL